MEGFFFLPLLMPVTGIQERLFAQVLDGKAYSFANVVAKDLYLLL
jgi:hypothetical protein